MYKQFQENKAQLFRDKVTPFCFALTPKPKIKIYEEDIDLSTFGVSQPAALPAPVPLTMHEKVAEMSAAKTMPEPRQAPPETAPAEKPKSPLIYGDIPNPISEPGEDTSVLARLKLQETSRFHIHKRIIFGNISKFEATGEG